MSRTISQELWRQTPRHVFRLDLTAKRFEQLQALWRWSVPFGDICRINYGAQISSAEPKAFGRDRHLHDAASGLVDPKRFYEGSDMSPWHMEWAGVHLEWAARDSFYGPRTESLFENPKLSIRHISGDRDSFVAWVDGDGYYTDHGVIHCVPYRSLRDEPSYRVTDEQSATSANYDLHYLLGIVMSRTVLDYYGELYATGSLQGAFSHVYPNTVKDLPIPRLDGRLPDPPADWLDSLGAAVGGDRQDRAALRRGFASRDEAAAALAAAAERRQDVEGRRVRRRKDFADFMKARAPGWGWPAGASLEAPPPEDDFLASFGDRLESVQALTVIRGQFREQVAAAGDELSEALLLERGIDVLAERVFALAA
jgi:hypothetical protein